MGIDTKQLNRNKYISYISLHIYPRQSKSEAMNESDYCFKLYLMYGMPKDSDIIVVGCSITHCGVHGKINFLPFVM